MTDTPAGRRQSADGIRAVILDYGQVLCHRPAVERVSLMSGALGLDPKTFATRYHNARGAYDRGNLSAADYWSKVVADTAELGDDLLGKLRRWDVEIWSDINREMTEWLERVRAAGFKTAVLSNMHADMAAHARSTFDWLRRVDFALLSCEFHLIKPDRAIYERCIECLAVQPSEALFVDDREENVTAAREAGWLTLRFESVAGLRRDLEEMGFPVLPPARAGDMPSSL